MATKRKTDKIGKKGADSTDAKVIELKKEDFFKLREVLSALEHEQWITWSKELVNRGGVSQYIIDNWQQFWIPYEELGVSDVKNWDRMWVDCVLEVMSNFGIRITYKEEPMT